MKHLSQFFGITAVLSGMLLIFFEPLTDWRISRLTDSVIESVDVSPSSHSDKVQVDTHYDFDAVEELDLNAMMDLPHEKDLAAIGKLEMPDVDMTIPILEGLSHDNLMAGAGTMKEDQQPGDSNYAIAGHNWPDRTTLFSPLHRAEEGMRIFLTVKGETYEYVVSTIQMVDPTRIDVIEDQNDPLLTLVTCNHDGTERLIVQASLV